MSQEYLFKVRMFISYQLNCPNKMPRQTFLLKYITNGKEKKDSLKTGCTYIPNRLKNVSVILILFSFFFKCTMVLCGWDPCMRPVVYSVVGACWVSVSMGWLWRQNYATERARLLLKTNTSSSSSSSRYFCSTKVQKIQITNYVTGALIQQKSTHYSVHTKTKLSPFYNSHDVSWF